MSFSEEDIKMMQGRMGYEFSTCFKGSELIFRKLAKHFEPLKSCATRYGFEITVDLNIEKDKFQIKSVGSKFLTQYNNSLLVDILELEESGGLTAAERRNIVKKSQEMIPNCSEDTELTMLAMADLFKLFLKPKSYKSVIVSAIVNYGKDMNMSHQCAFMALGHPHNTFMFYEPYGLYKKYGVDYKKCFADIFSVYQTMPDFSDWDYKTYHDYFGFEKGLQGMMLDQGKLNKEDFMRRYKDIKKRMGASGEKWRYENDESDDTFAVSTLMSKVSNKSEFIREAAILYRDYSAKICVSIFLVESARLMLYLAKSPDSYDSLKYDLSSWYSNFGSEATSKILIELYQIIDLIYPDEISEYVYKVFSDVENNPEDICRKLATPVS